MLYGIQLLIAGQVKAHPCAAASGMDEGRWGNLGYPDCEKHKSVASKISIESVGVDG